MTSSVVPFGWATMAMADTTTTVEVTGRVLQTVPSLTLSIAMI